MMTVRMTTVIAMTHDKHIKEEDFRRLRTILRMIAVMSVTIENDGGGGGVLEDGDDKGWGW